MDIVVEITKFQEYKGRKDVTHNSWFRLSNRFLEDSDFFEFKAEEKLVWIYLLSLASQKNQARVHVSLQHAHQVCNLNPKSVKSAIEKLKKLGCLSTPRARSERGRYVDDTQTCATDITNITNITEQDIAPVNGAPVNPVSFYCDLWKSRNGKSPDIRGKEAGQITKLAKDLGVDRACEIMRAYFSMPDPFFIKRGYDVSTMLSNLGAIQQFEANGKIVTKKVIEHFEEKIDKAQGTSRRPRKSLEEMERDRAAMMAEAQAPKAIGGKS